MSKKTHTDEIRKEHTIRAGERIIYKGRKLDVRKLMFALYCQRNGLNPWNGISPTSKKGGAS